MLQSSSLEANKGILIESDIKKVACKEITPDQFLKLCHHLKIITPLKTLKPDGDVKYFIPCVLSRVPESAKSSLETDILPLAVTFKCRHCPKGVFGVLVTYLMNPEFGASTRITFTLLEDEIFREQVSFRVIFRGSSGDLSLKVFSSHLQLKFKPHLLEGCEFPRGDMCENIRVAVEKYLDSALKDLNYDEDNVKPQMSFECPSCCCLHKVEDYNEYAKCHVMVCNSSSTSVRIPDNGRCWYNEGIAMSTNVFHVSLFCCLGCADQKSSQSTEGKCAYNIASYQYCITLKCLFRHSDVYRLRQFSP